ncbi:heme peroxidase [Hygrophoropsis aurantiaca]|uniref:Heme peroxidase n=1 Tax=Hygrophoropsis aurantiaca TaxID=72124 RepID=A0ACB8AF48_9AGAM|nr:heme peroxidase [Hygrophoropsis aurantiaca]
MQGHLNTVKRLTWLFQNVAVTVATDIEAHSVPILLTRTTTDIEQVALRGPPLSLNDLPVFIQAARNLNSGINDREFLLEKLLVLMSRLPNDSSFGKALQFHVIDILYKDLPHPPTSYLSTFKLPTLALIEDSSKHVPYVFRSADGSNYTGLAPSLGQAGQPYARSVSSVHITSLSELPDPGVVFDTLLRRDNGDFVPHPGGLSSLFFAFADLIIHNIFSTDPQNWRINTASSYLDLSVIYGNSQAQVDSVRRKDGTGRLWDDVFANSRLLFMPPSVGALAVLMSRHHNYIADKILSINECGIFVFPPPLEDADRTAQCDEIFHRARLVNTAFFMQIILSDYVGSILGLVRDGLTWRLNPLDAFRESGHELSTRGGGNAVSLEFNMLYRWHAAISAHDEEWLTGLFDKVFDGKDSKSMTSEDFQRAARTLVAPGTDIRNWTFNNMMRNSEGRFDDGELAKILHDATEHPAGAFRARGVPDVMRAVEILGMEQARAWGACTLNEFRKFMGLKPYHTFKEWNPDPAIYEAAESLYHDIDNLELHVGLQAEETKPPIPGAGLCPGYTVSRAILADAVCLTRGDRFLTVDFTPYNLTTWGYQHCIIDKSDGSFGGMLTGLLFRMLPKHYPAGSAYAHFPFMVPDFMRSRISEMPEKSIAAYNWSRPMVIDEEYRHSGAAYTHRLSILLQGKELSSSSIQAIISTATVSGVSFETLTRSLIAQHAVKGSDSLPQIDIVKNVLNLLPAQWAANIIGLPVKTEKNPLGEYFDEHWYNLFADVSRYLFLNEEPALDWMLKRKAIDATNRIIQHIRGHLHRLNDGIVSPATFYDYILTGVTGKNAQSNALLSKILASYKQLGIDGTADIIFAEAIPSAALFSAALTSVIDFYLTPGQEKGLGELVTLSASSSPEANAQTLAYIHKALHCRFDAGGVGDGPLLSQLALGKHEIPLPFQNGLLSPSTFASAAPQVLRAVFALKGVHKKPSTSVVRASRGVSHSNVFTSRFGEPILPIAMTIQYDA